MILYMYKNSSQFITKAKLVHGDKYDYSKVNYTNSKTKVCIICPEHGEFWQIATEHLQGHGCPYCYGNAKTTTEEFITKAKLVHGDKYDYSKVKYKNNREKIIIICPIHGTFIQSPKNHLNGQGCPICGKVIRYKNVKKTTNEFVEKAKKIHGDKYDYSKVEYKGCNEQVCIICPEHGEFWQTPHNHLSGCGCKQCNISKRQNNENTINIDYLNLGDKFIKKSKIIHNDKYDYSRVNYKNANTKVCIICPEHGEFWQTPHDHLKGCGCIKCGISKRTKNRTLNTLQFINKANIVHHNFYDYSKTDYMKSNENVIITCPIHGDFKQIATEHLQVCNCPKCANKISYSENDIAKFINNKIEVKQHIRYLIPPKELDIYIPEKNLAIEYDGLHWHSEQFKDDAINYHIDKTNECIKQGIRLIHIFEDEWIDKQEIVKSRLNSILGLTINKIRAHKCEIHDVDSKTAMQFLDDNHLQGRCKAKYHYGLFYKNELVSLMTFGKIRQQKKYHEDYDNKWELLRFCNKLNTTVYGSASKLLNHFINEIKPKTIVSYADKRWSDGNLYIKLGFTHTHDSKPNYFYIIGQHRENRFKYRKGELVKKYKCPSEMSEHEFCKSKGWFRIYDCGTMVFEMNL